MHDEAVRKDLQKRLDGEDDQKHIFNLFLERHKEKEKVKHTHTHQIVILKMIVKGCYSGGQNY